jgi:putative transposase
VIVEKLQVQNMTKSAHGTIDKPGKNVRQKAGLSRSILDACWGRLVEMLRYKLNWSGGILEEVPAAYSSQTCAVCGEVNEASRRSQSKFVCVACGHSDHADVNAAKVLLSRRTDGGAVCGGHPIQGPKKQKLRVVRRGTRRDGLELEKVPNATPR